MEKKIEIGVAVVNYSEEGKATSAEFKPTMQVVATDELLSQLIVTNEPAKDSNTIKNNAELIMSAWFSKMNEVELADRDRYHIVSEVLECNKYPNGNVQFCKMKFVFQSISSS